MRIALLAPRRSEPSGIAGYADSFAQALAGVDVEAVSPWGPGPLPDNEAGIAARMSAIKWSSFNLVHAEIGGGRVGEFLALEWLAHHCPELPLTATVHDPERLIWRPVRLPAPLSVVAAHSQIAYKASALLVDRWTLERERRLASRLSRLVALTRTGARSMQRRLGLDAEKVASIPHGNAQIASAPLPPSRVLQVLYFGFVHRGKGLEDLLEAFAVLMHGNPQLAAGISLTIAGGTQPEIAFGADGGYLDSLRRLVRQLGLDDAQIRWQLDVPSKEVPALIQSHHVMVLPYRESMRLSLLGRMHGTSGALSWAAACGRGVIASNARAFAEEVSLGNGTVYPQGDIDALAEEIIRCREEPILVRERAACAAELGRERAWPVVVSRFREVFDGVATH